MALPWLEGEVFFIRNALVDRHYNFNPNDADQFYGHMLIEHVWNRWTVSNWTTPNFNQIARRPHPRSRLEIGRAQQYRTDFGHFPHWWINFGNDRRGWNISRSFNAQPNQNRNEMRDLDAGGPAKVVFRPVPLGKEEFVFIDMTQPIRAVYFPIAHRSEESVPNLCTYLMVDFRLRSRIVLNHFTQDRTPPPYTPDRTYGLFTDVYYTLGIHIPSLIETLSWPRQFRGPAGDLYSSSPRGQETIYFLFDTDIDAPRSHTMTNFGRVIDIVTIINAHQGVQLQYRPFEFRSFIVDALRQVIGLGLGFIPGVGTLLAISFNVAWELIENPDRFREVFGPSLGLDTVAGLIEAGIHFRKRSILPRSNQPFILQGEWEFEDRMPPLTSPTYTAGPPPDEVLSGDGDNPNKEVIEPEREGQPELTSPTYTAGPPPDEVLPGDGDNPNKEVVEPEREGQPELTSPKDTTGPPLDEVPPGHGDDPNKKVVGGAGDAGVSGHAG